MAPRAAVLAAQTWTQAAAAWTFVALLAVASWYRLPLHPLHRSICLGAAPYLAACGKRLDVLAHTSHQPVLVALDPDAYAATVGIWATAAWSLDEFELGRAVASNLYPWVRP
jgi:hypothetical protein